MSPDLRILETPNADGSYPVPCTLSYLGDGTISFIHKENWHPLIPYYDETTRKITLGLAPNYSQSDTIMLNSWEGTIQLSASSGYTADSLSDIILKDPMLSSDPETPKTVD